MENNGQLKKRSLQLWVSFEDYEQIAKAGAKEGVGPSEFVLGLLAPFLNSLNALDCHWFAVALNEESYRQFMKIYNGETVMLDQLLGEKLDEICWKSRQGE
jgi:hypothetical protein